MNAFLSGPDLHQLTGYARTGKQVEWLRNQGIPYKVDGVRVIVMSQHVANWMEGRATVQSSGPNWGAVK